jgi:ribonuclease HI
MQKERGIYFRTCWEDNLEGRNIGKHVTPADKIRMALRSFAKDLNISAIEPESSIGKMSDSFIQRNLFAWKNLGNAKNRTEEQEHLLKLKTSEFLASISPDDIICFTDGSVTNQDEKGLGACGAGCIIYNHGLTSDPIIISAPISSKSTAYHGEIAAIDIALNFCKNLYGRKIFILSDCQSAIESVSNNITPDSYATLLNSIKSKSCLLNDRQCIITISWIGGHCGILGNELADKAAKSACLQALTLPPYLSMKAAKSFILQGIKLDWQKMWDT